MELSREIRGIMERYSITMERLTFANLQVRYMVGRAEQVGTDGRRKILRHFERVYTNLGELDRSDWISLANWLIDANNERELFQQLYQWEEQRNYTNRSEKDLTFHVLSLHVSRIFDDTNWVEFVSFNSEYRPDVLQITKLVTVINECCNQPGLVTQEMVNEARNDKICCPHCGRWSSFRVVESQDGSDNPI